LLSPFLVKMGVTAKEEFDQLCDQISYEMQTSAFRGLWFLLSVWGTKLDLVQHSQRKKINR